MLGVSARHDMSMHARVRAIYAPRSWQCDKRPASMAGRTVMIPPVVLYIADGRRIYQIILNNQTKLVLIFLFF
jgi:hypothetical protein